MKYRQMTEEDLKVVVEMNIDYYNNVEDCEWTFEKNYKRNHQVFSMEDSYCLVQEEDNGKLVGSIVGYIKEFEDITGYYLEEIVIARDSQNKGYGTAFLMELEKRLREKGVVHIDLSSVNDDMHKHFYNKLGYYEADNFSMMGKFFD